MEVGPYTTGGYLRQSAAVALRFYSRVVEWHYFTC
jgi:hypothetical protein